MVKRILLTGATGYIGGSVLEAIANRYSECNITVLLRTPSRNFSETYPRVKVVQGTYEDTSLLKAISSETDIVIHCGDSDHERCLNAMLTGLRTRQDSTPGFLIHLSGTGVLFDWHQPHNYGNFESKIWSDVEDLQQIKCLPGHVIHRNTEKMLFSFAEQHGENVKVAIISPPDIYGSGHGPGRKSSVYMPTFLREMKKFGSPFFVNTGTNRRSWVHIDDLVRLYLHLVDAAVRGGGGAEWGNYGYYFAATHDVSQLDLAENAARILHTHDIIPNAQSAKISVARVDDMMEEYRAYNLPLARNIFAYNSVSQADRAKRLFDYQGSMSTVLQCMEEDLLNAHLSDRQLQG